MAASKREAALEALRAVIAAQIPGALVRRNDVARAKLPSGGRIDIRDGESGEPEVTMSPRAYYYDHEAVLIVEVQDKDAVVRNTQIDQILQGIGKALEADPTLGGAVEWAEAEAPAETVTEAVEGAPDIRASEVVVVLQYETNSPLG